MSGSAPVALGHVGITVPDVDRATEWYASVFDLQILDHRVDAKASDSPEMAAAIAEIYDERCEGLRISFLVSANGACLELFEFLGLEYVSPESPTPYHRGGVFHLSLVHPDIEVILGRVESAGGSRRTEVMAAFPGQPYRFAYCADPWGNLLEIQSHSTAQMFSNQTP